MALYAIGDLHLSLASNKPMEVFGEGWRDYVRRLEEAFAQLNDDDVTVLCGDLSWGMSVITEEDTTVLCGDLSWALDLQEAKADFAFINAIPGRKIILKGNHDYWWNTASKMEKFFAQHELTTLEILLNNCKFYGDIALCGTRGWFYELDNQGTHNEKVLLREAGRLETSLQAAGEKEKICFLHYPPVFAGTEVPQITEILSRYPVQRVFYLFVSVARPVSQIC